MATSRKIITMNEVAKAANVSQTCVSMVLSGNVRGNIPKETEEKVLRICRELGYHKNRIAGSLNMKGGNTDIIGLVADNLLDNDFAHEIIAGCQAAAMELNKTLMIATVDGKNEERDNTAIQALLDFQVSSIVYATYYYHEVKLPPTVLCGKPLCLINCFTSQCSLPSVIPDDYKGAEKATEEIIKAGHKKIVFLSNSLAYNGKLIPATEKREAAFKDTTKRYGLDECKIVRMEIKMKAIIDTVRPILESRERPTAIFCYNDRLALCLISIAKDMGLKIPESLSVVGYDNQEVISNFITPRLTTVALPHFDMGYNAIKVATGKRIDTVEPLLIEPVLIKGSSVLPLH